MHRAAFRAAPPRHRRTGAIALHRPTVSAQRLRRARRFHHLHRISGLSLLGFALPLPFIQLGHYLFGWDSIAVMIGGLG